MPYPKITSLPGGVRNVLPEHAQVIFRKTYNNAWKEYRLPEDRKYSASREETAHKVAWGAVKQVYKKNGDQWVKKSKRKKVKKQEN